MRNPPTPPAVSAPTPSDRLSTSQHTVTVAGRQLSYTATTGYIIFKEESEKKHEGGGFPPGEQPRAQIFFTAYTLNDQPNLAERPITFALNGGPGSASVWLHLGLLGPHLQPSLPDAHTAPAGADQLLRGWPYDVHPPTLAAAPAPGSGRLPECHSIIHQVSSLPLLLL